MKTIFITRHAKAIPPSNQVDDFDRWLNEKGFAQAEEIGAAMKDQNLIPDLIITSPADRASTTAFLFSSAFEADQNNIREEKIIYEGHAKDLMGLISGVDKKYHHVMLIGHNPVLKDLISLLTNERPEHFSTCSIAVVSFNFSSWKEIKAGSGSLNSILIPSAG